MPQRPFVLIALLLAVGTWFLLRRANELCVLSVRSGRSRLVRGRAPAGLLSDVSEIVKRARLERATFRVVVESGSPRLHPRGVSSEVEQQLRNVVGQYRVVQFRSGRRA